MNPIQVNKTVAVIDVGSNSIKLLIARRNSETHHIESVYKKTCKTRISAGISQQRPALSEEAMESGCHSISELVSIARSYAPEAIEIVATSAVRDATNAREFTKRVNDVTGIPVNVLSGIEEATCIAKGLNCDPGIAGLKNFVQMDIGGGSLELIRFSQGSIETVCSLQLGAVRLTEKLIPDHITAINLKTETTLRNHVRESLQQSCFAFEPKEDPIIVTGGVFPTIRSILGSRTGREIEDTSPVIDRKDIAELKATLCNLSLDERKAIPGLPADRADIIPAALITIDTVMECAGRDKITHSFYNLRYGVAAELLA